MNYKDFILVLNRVINSSNDISIKNSDKLFLIETVSINGDVIKSNMPSMIVDLLKNLKIEPDYDLILEVLQNFYTEDQYNYLSIETLYSNLQDKNVLTATVVENSDGIHFEYFEQLLLKEFPNSRISDDMKMYVSIPRIDLENGFKNIAKTIKNDYERSIFFDIFDSIIYEKYDPSNFGKIQVKEVLLDFLWMTSFRNYKTATLDVQNNPELIPGSPKF